GADRKTFRIRDSSLLQHPVDCEQSGMREVIGVSPETRRQREPDIEDFRDDQPGCIKNGGHRKRDWNAHDERGKYRHNGKSPGSPPIAALRLEKGLAAFAGKERSGALGPCRYFMITGIHQFARRAVDFLQRSLKSEYAPQARVTEASSMRKPERKRCPTTPWSPRSSITRFGPSHRP